MNENIKLLTRVTTEYSTQCTELLQIAEKTEGKAAPQCNVLLHLIKAGLAKLTKQAPQKCLNYKRAHFRAMLQSHIDFLELTRGEIERLKS